MTVMENLVAGASADSRKFPVAASLEEVFHLFPVL
jgi:ABC-type branched-subunit amino acid transport system ATPase component